jgi:hypothetical protein
MFLSFTGIVNVKEFVELGREKKVAHRTRTGKKDSASGEVY